MADFWELGLWHAVMRADLRISVKGYSRESQKVLLFRVPFRTVVPAARGGQYPPGPGWFADWINSIS